jgi:metal-sulfur cluster biosynthetic enzyme
MTDKLKDNYNTSDYLCEIINENPNIPTIKIIQILKNIFDPDIHYSVYDIGLIYKIVVNEKKINIIMTLTSINCPEAQSLPEEIEKTMKEKFPNLETSVEITFEPMWTIDNMNDEIKLSLGLL